MPILVKVIDVENSEIHRLSISKETSFEQFSEIIRSLFATAQDRNFSLFYIDEDNDFVTISTTEDLTFALNSQSPNTTLRLFFSPQTDKAHGMESSSSVSSHFPTERLKKEEKENPFDSKRKVVDSYLKAKYVSNQRGDSSTSFHRASAPFAFPVCHARAVGHPPCHFLRHIIGDISKMFERMGESQEVDGERAPSTATTPTSSPSTVINPVATLSPSQLEVLTTIEGMIPPPYIDAFHRFIGGLSPHALAGIIEMAALFSGVDTKEKQHKKDGENEGKEEKEKGNAVGNGIENPNIPPAAMGMFPHLMRMFGEMGAQPPCSASPTSSTSSVPSSAQPPTPPNIIQMLAPFAASFMNAMQQSRTSSSASTPSVSSAPSTSSTTSAPSVPSDSASDEAEQVARAMAVQTSPQSSFDFFNPAQTKGN